MREDLREAGTGLALAIAVLLIVAAACRADDAADEIAAIQEQCLQKNNELRAARGLRPHKLNAALNAAAQDHAAYMARTGSFGHYSNGGPGGRAARHGFGAGARENIACGQQTVAIVFDKWHGSRGHYANMMSATREAGFGLAYSVHGTPVWCALYGTSPDPATESSDEQPAPSPPSTGSQQQTSPQRPGILGWILGRRSR